MRQWCAICKRYSLHKNGVCTKCGQTHIKIGGAW